MKYCEAVSEAQRGADETSLSRMLSMARIVRQMTAILHNGKTVSLTENDVRMIPLSYGAAIRGGIDDALNDDAAKKEAVILNKGDGITSPILVKLGSPIKQADRVVTELEFQARTIGDLEDIICLDDTLSQTKAILAIATPIGEKVTLSSLTTDHLNQISMMDGLFILNNVTGVFFGMPTN